MLSLNCQLKNWTNLIAKQGEFKLYKNCKSDAHDHLGYRLDVPMSTLYYVKSNKWHEITKKSNLKKIVDNLSCFMIRLICQ